MFTDRKNGQQPVYFSVMQRDRSMNELTHYGGRPNIPQQMHIQNVKFVRGMPVQQIVKENQGMVSRMPAVQQPIMQRQLRSSSSMQSLYSNRSHNMSENVKSTKGVQQPISPIVHVQQQSKPQFQPQFFSQPINVLRKQRIITNQEPDHKADLQVMKAKYKALEQTYQKLSQQLNTMEKSDSIKYHSRRPTQVNQLYLEDINEENSSQDRIEEIVTTRIDQELQKFKAQNNEREELIKSKYESYIENLKAENNQLKKQLEARSKSGSNTPLRSSRSKVSEQGISSLQKSLQRLVGQLQEAKQEIRKKDEKIQSLRLESITNSDKANHEKAIKQLEKVRSIISQKEHQINSLLAKISMTETTHVKKHEHQNLLRKIQQKISENQKYMIEVGMLKDSLLDKQTTIGSMQSEKQELQIEINRLKSSNSNLISRINSIEQTINQQAIDSQDKQHQLKQQVTRLEDERRHLLLDIEQKSQKIRHLDNEVKKYFSILEQNRRQHSQNMKDSDRRLQVLKKQTIEQQATIQQLRIDLEFKRAKPKDNPSKPQSNETQLKQQISRLTAQLTQRRIEYQINLRRMRQQCENAYRQTLQIYEQKIEQLSRKRNRSKDSSTQHSLKRVVSQQKIHDKIVGYDELQDRITDFQIRVNQLVEDREADPNMYNADNALHKLVAQLNTRIRLFKAENVKLRNMVSGKKQKQVILKQFTQQNKQLIKEKTKHEESIGLMKNQISHLRGVIKNYQKAIYQLQVGQQFLPPNQQLNTQQKLTMLTQKVDFYKQKHRDMQARVKDLLNVNSQLKSQLQQSAKNQNKHDSYSQYTAVNTNKLQQQLRNSQQELMHLKNEHLLKIQSMQRESQSKISQLQNEVVQLNVRIATLKNDRSINQNEYILIKDTLAHRQTLVNELNSKVSQMRRQNAQLLVDRRKKQELESSLGQAMSRINSLNTQKNNLQSQSSGMKKHISYIEKQLLTTNQKLSAISNTHLNTQIQLTQAKTSMNHLQKRCNELSQEVKTLQRYRLECDTSANDDRHRMNQLQVRLKDNYYQLQKVNKIKQSLEQEISSLKSTVSSQKQQLVSAISRSKQHQKQLSKLQSESQNQSMLRQELARTRHENMVLTASLQSSKYSQQHQYAKVVEEFQSKLEHLNAQFRKLDQKNKMLQSQLETQRHERSIIEKQAKNKISALQSSLNSLGSNQSTERDTAEIDQLRQKLYNAETIIRQIKIQFQSKLDHMNNEYIHKHHLMERHYLNQIGDLTNQLDQFKKNKFSTDIVQSCLHFIQKIRHMCHELFNIVRQVYKRLDPAEGLPNILEQYSEAIELSCQELISEYASYLHHVDQVIQK